MTNTWFLSVRHEKVTKVNLPKKVKMQIFPKPPNYLTLGHSSLIHMNRAYLQPTLCNMHAMKYVRASQNFVRVSQNNFWGLAFGSKTQLWWPLLIPFHCIYFPTVICNSFFLKYHLSETWSAHWNLMPNCPCVTKYSLSHRKYEQV